jgi:hypothetical protein
MKHTFTDFDTLLHAVHGHVQREGGGKCKVTSGDDPRQLLLGYLVVGADGTETSYQIRLRLFKAATKWSRLASIEERGRVAAILESGLLPTP